MRTTRLNLAMPVSPGLEYAGTDLSYRTARRFVEAQYAQAHNATIECDFPTLMVVSDHAQQPLSVAGVRSPLQHFFLEHYLDGSAEQVLSEHFRKPVARQNIVEIGNLAGSRDRHATTFLLHQTWDYLIRCGFEYLMLTGTCRLLHRFRQLPLHHLADARADQIPNPGRWGSYYEESPQVVAGKLAGYDFRFFRRRQPDKYHFDILTIGDDG